MEVCRSKNMPKASVDNAIKSAEKAKAASQMVYEARGPGGCLLLIEILTDNLNRTRHEMKFLLSKNGAALSEGVRHGFTRKGVVTSLAKTLSLERALELAIEAGAEDVQETEDEEEQPLLKFICDIVELKNVRTALESEGMSIVSSGVECIPRNMSSLNEEQLNVAASLLEALQNCPDVVRVWDNIQASS
ncbi:translational activator of cytochrome c oxidase 1 isoform X2 [Cynoglossus semilaevis]|nr:translational activator of cytochrome c oxidase 1 isoform X2 [Cynoglossus semilaevis]